MASPACHEALAENVSELKPWDKDIMAYTDEQINAAFFKGMNQGCTTLEFLFGPWTLASGPGRFPLISLDVFYL
jgi:hypothetical protein